MRQGERRAVPLPRLFAVIKEEKKKPCFVRGELGVYLQSGFIALEGDGMVYYRHGTA